MINFILFVLCFFLAVEAYGVDPVYSTKDFKGGIYSKNALINGTAGAGYIELDHQSSNAGTPGSASNDVRVFAKSKKLYTATDDGAGNPIVTEIGSGASGGSINYITDRDAESNSVGAWVTYADAAGLSPVNCDGGSPNTAFSVTASSPLRGTYSYLATKNTGASRQGEGLAYAFTTALADASKMLTIGFSYKVASGTYAYGSGTAADPGDYVVYIYDVTNGVIIQPTNYMLNGSGEYVGQFQTDATSTSYKLCVHTAGTTNAAMTMKLDDISVGPKDVAKGPAITDAIAFTPVFNGMTSGIGIEKARYYRIGQQIQVEVEITSTGSASGTVAFRHVLSGLPGAAGSSLLGLRPTIGSGTLLTAGSTYPLTVVMDGDDIVFKVAEGSISATIPTADGGVDASDRLSFIATYPITGWGSNTVISSQDDGRLVEVSYKTTTAGSYATGATITYGTKLRDSHSAWSGTTFTAPSPGVYRFSAAVTPTNSEVGAAEFGALSISKGGSTYVLDRFDGVPNAILRLGGSRDLFFNAGETATIIVAHTTAANWTLSATDDGYNFITISKIAASETIAASEVVAARYSSNNADTMTDATEEVLCFEDKDYDTHGAVSFTNFAAQDFKFIAPIGGYYSFAISIMTATVQWTQGDLITITAKKNGSTTIGYYLNYQGFDAAGGQTYYGTAVLNFTAKLNAGDYVTPILTIGRGADTNLDTTSAAIFFNAHRIGGVM